MQLLAKAADVSRKCSVLKDFAQGMSVVAIGAKYGMSQPSVYHTVAVARPAYWNNMHPKTMTKILDLYSKDYDSQYIAEEMQLREDEIIGYLISKGLAPNDPGWSGIMKIPWETSLLLLSDSPENAKLSVALKTLHINGICTYGQLISHMYDIETSGSNIGLSEEDIKNLKKFTNPRASVCGGKTVKQVKEEPCDKTVELIETYLTNGVGKSDGEYDYVKLTLDTVFSGDDKPLRSSVVLLTRIEDWLQNNLEPNRKDVAGILKAYSVKECYEYYVNHDTLPEDIKLQRVGKVCILLLDANGYLLR